MSHGPTKSQVINGLRLSAKIVIAVMTLAFLIGGLTLLRFPVRGDPAFFASRHPFVIGSVLVIIAAGIIIPTVRHWVEALPGVLGYSVLGGLIAIGTGHLSNSHVQISNMDAATLTVALIGGTVLSLDFGKRNLSVLDRIALVAFVFCMAVATITKPPEMFIAFALALSFLLLAWSVNRIQRHRSQA